RWRPVKTSQCAHRLPERWRLVKTSQCAHRLSEGVSSPSPEPVQSPPSASKRASACEPWRSTIEGKVKLGLSAQRIYQDLTAEHGYQGTYFSVRRFVRRLGARMNLPVRRFESEPGDEA